MGERYLVLDFRVPGQIFSYVFGKAVLNEFLGEQDPKVLGEVDLDHSGSLNMVDEGVRGILILKLGDLVQPARIPQVP